MKGWVYPAMNPLKRLYTKVICFLYATVDENELFYINGSDTLRSPLEKEDEQALIYRLGKDLSVRDT